MVLVDDTAVAFACAPSDVQRIRLSPWSELRDQDKPEVGLDTWHQSPMTYPI